MIKGSKMTIEQRKKLSIAHIGKSTWNKGMKGFRKGHEVLDETRKKISQSLLGHKGYNKGVKLNLNLGIINCEKCEKEIIKTGGMKKYCETCGEIKGIERHRRYEKRNPEKIILWRNKSARKQRDKFPVEIFARSQANIHTELKPFCEICKSTNNLQRHHWRYDKPLMVNTLCKECHTIQHVKNFNNSRFARKMEEISQ